MDVKSEQCQSGSWFESLTANDCTVRRQINSVHAHPELRRTEQLLGAIIHCQSLNVSHQLDGANSGTEARSVQLEDWPN